LERESGKICGKDFGLCYSPEFIALGSVIRDFLNPDFTLIGEFDARCGSQLEACYAEIMENHPVCQRMSIENAELTKISANAFVTTKITFANMLLDLCERIPGGDVDAVTRALGCDRRIGSQYLIGALGYGGPCFPRDNVALSFIARAIGSCADLAETTDRMNRALPEKIIDRLRPLIREGATVAVLGLAYKPFSHVIEESQGVALAKAFFKAGARVIAYDPLADELAQHELGDQATIVNSIAECVRNAEMVLLTTPDPAFRALTPADFANHRAIIVVDFWRILDQTLANQPNIRYLPIGRSRDETANVDQLKWLWSNRELC
jgi:UDPglucose 6-dehydrogenase